MAVFTFHDPRIVHMPGIGIQVVSKCDAEKTLIFSRQVTTVDMRHAEILIFLEGGTIVQLVDMPNIQTTYDLIVTYLAI